MLNIFVVDLYDKFGLISKGFKNQKH